MKNHPSEEPEPKPGIADCECNACKEIHRRAMGWRTWIKTFCTKTGKNARFYRISAPEETT